MKRQLRRIFGWTLLILSCLFAFSSLICMFMSLVNVFEFDSLAQRLLASVIFIVITYVCWQLMRLSVKILPKRSEEKPPRIPEERKIYPATAQLEKSRLQAAQSTPQPQQTESQTSRPKPQPQQTESQTSRPKPQPQQAKSKAASVPAYTNTIDDVTFIAQINHSQQGPWHSYSVKLAARPIGWNSIIDWADYAAQADFTHIDKVTMTTSVSGPEIDLTEGYHRTNSVKEMKELEQEGAQFSLAGTSKALHALTKIIWYNQTNILTIFTLLDNDDILNRYVETLARRTFGTADSMAKAKPLPQVPVSVSGNQIELHSADYFRWYSEHHAPYELAGSIRLEEKTPSIILYEDGKQVHTYVLETKEDEDFTNQYFIYGVRINPLGNPPVPAVQIDGFIADSPDVKEMGSRIGYRFEGYLPFFGGAEAERRRKAVIGRDLYEKGLRYRGYTTPGNVRLVGICSHCGKSITFKGYSYHLMQADALYSDDGLSVEPSYDPNFDKENGVVEKDGKTYRFYNSFRCRHCGKPYIDYARIKDMKSFGVLGCSYEL